MSAAVEVFEVGQQQLINLLGFGACVGDYVSVSTFGRFGYVSDNIICWGPESQDIDSLLASFGYLCERDIWALGEGLTQYAQEYEIWHVVDDDDLWQAWEHEVWIAKKLSGGMYDEVYMLPNGTEDAGIETQRKASACRISLDNGHTYLDPVRDEADLQDLIVFLDMYPHIWDLIVSGYMDDETRELTHRTSSYTGMLPDEHTSTAMIRACWLCDYLANAYTDLIY